MTPRQARRERREAERKAKKLEFQKARQASGALSSATENRPASASPSAGRFTTSPSSAVSSKEFPDIQPRWNPELEDEFPREVQIRNNAIADRIALQAGLPIPPPGPTPGPFASLEEMRAHYRPVGDGHARPAPPANPLHPEPNNGFVSRKRAEANRANSKLSTGPRSKIGKSASSRNSTKHGLASGQLILPGEDPTEFESLLTDLLNDRQPADRTEELLVTEMAQSHWLAQRAIRLQNGCFSENGVDEKGLSLFLRYFTTHNRAFHKALGDLQRVQKERRKVERGFVSQTVAKTAGDSGFVSQKRASAADNGEFVRQNDLSTTLDTGFVSQTECTDPSERSRPAKQAA